MDFARQPVKGLCINLSESTIHDVLYNFQNDERFLLDNTYLLFWFKYGTSGGVTYDLVGPVVNNALNYGAAFRPPVFTADGRIVYASLLGNLGTAPAAQSAAYISTRTQMGIAQGYYVVQVGTLSYDMVSALDGKAWINWFYL